MLGDLFKPAWKSSSVEKRLKAIIAMDDSSSEIQSILNQMATQDQETSICIEAIKKITSVDALHQLSIQHNSEFVRSAADIRLNELIASGNAISTDEYKDLLKRLPELNLRIAAHADNPSIRSIALKNLSANQLLDALSQTLYTDSRNFIAEKLTELKSLESARKILRGKHKSSERIIKQKIDAIRKKQRQDKENLATVEKLIDEVEYLVSHDWLAEFNAKLLAHREKWDSLDFTIDANTMRRYQQSRDIIDKRYEEQKFIEETRQSQQQLLFETDAMLKDITGRELSGFIQDQIEIQNKQEQLISSWKQLAQKVRPHLSLVEQFDNMLSAMQLADQLVSSAKAILQSKEPTGTEESGCYSKAEATDNLTNKVRKLNAVLSALKWPVEYGELKAATELSGQLSEWRKTLKNIASEQEKNLDNLHKKINSILRFSRSGHLHRAGQMTERVEKSLNQFSGKDRKSLEERLEKARQTLGKMGDWKNFATEPKYIELCEAMEKLISSKLHPDKLSKQMKDLQQQWKSLGHSEISDRYWDRFKQAADQVYKPCAEFFDERHKLRQSNLEKRQQYVTLMQQLLEETDWDHDPDYKAAQSTLRRVSDQFLKIKDVEHKAGQKQWKKFTGLKDRVFAKLEVAYEANIELKRQLIKQTEALAEAPAKEDNLAKLKTLQTRWKLIGITRRNQDQKAWLEFKKQGDRVYDKVQQLRQGKRDVTDQQLNAYRDIIKQIQQLAKTAKKLSEADQQFTHLQEQYSALPELPEQLPEKLKDGIHRDYQKACRLFDDCHGRIVDNQKNLQLKALRQKAELCQQQEALGNSASEQQLQEISLKWDAIEIHDAELNRRIQQRRDSALSTPDRESIGSERRMLCIQLEIIKGLESPDEDKDLRMQYQLDRMNRSGLGQQSLNTAGQIENFKLDWLCMPGAEPELQKQLEERFWRTLDL